jgi:hypothetical protein
VLEWSLEKRLPRSLVDAAPQLVNLEKITFHYNDDVIDKSVSSFIATLAPQLIEVPYMDQESQVKLFALFDPKKIRSIHLCKYGPDWNILLDQRLPNLERVHIVLQNAADFTDIVAKLIACTNNLEYVEIETRGYLVSLSAIQEAVRSLPATNPRLRTINFHPLNILYTFTSSLICGDWQQLPKSVPRLEQLSRPILNLPLNAVKIRCQSVWNIVYCCAENDQLLQCVNDTETWRRLFDVCVEDAASKFREIVVFATRLSNPELLPELRSQGAILSALENLLEDLMSQELRFYPNGPNAEIAAAIASVYGLQMLTHQFDAEIVEKARIKCLEAFQGVEDVLRMSFHCRNSLHRFPWPTTPALVAALRFGKWYDPHSLMCDLQIDQYGRKDDVFLLGILSSASLNPDIKVSNGRLLRVELLERYFCWQRSSEIKAIYEPALISAVQLCIERQTKLQLSNMPGINLMMICRSSKLRELFPQIVEDFEVLSQTLDVVQERFFLSSKFYVILSQMLRVLQETQHLSEERMTDIRRKIGTSLWHMASRQLNYFYGDEVTFDYKLGYFLNICPSLPKEMAAKLVAEGTDSEANLGILKLMKLVQKLRKYLPLSLQDE